MTMDRREFNPYTRDVEIVEFYETEVTTKKGYTFKKEFFRDKDCAKLFYRLECEVCGCIWYAFYPSQEECPEFEIGKLQKQLVWMRRNIKTKEIQMTIGAIKDATIACGGCRDLDKKIN